MVFLYSLWAKNSFYIFKGLYKEPYQDQDHFPYKDLLVRLTTESNSVSNCGFLEDFHYSVKLEWFMVPKLNRVLNRISSRVWSSGTK